MALGSPSYYSIRKFFSNSNWNAIIDNMYYHLTNQFGSNLNLSFGLTGRAAAIHQGFIPASGCDNVIFITNNAGIYSFVKEQLPGLLPNEGVIKFKERTLFYWNDLYIEIWYQQDEPDIHYWNEFYVQRSGSINPILL